MQKKIITLQNNDSLTDVSADRNIEQSYVNTLENFNTFKTFAYKILTLHRGTYACEQAFSVMNFRKINFFPELNDLHFMPLYAFILHDSKQTFISLSQGHPTSEILIQRVKEKCKGFTNFPLH
jgi:hypothetical protein